MVRIRKDDTVIVTAGKDKGKIGKILSFSKDRARAFVSGINTVKKHVKANPQVNEKGGIIQKEASIHISNVRIFNNELSKVDKIKQSILEDGTKVRVFRSNNQPIASN